MTTAIILASASTIRAQLLQNAGVDVTVFPARIDEDAVRASLEAENANPRDIADRLAELKAQKVSLKFPTELVIGCDQVLAFDRAILSKPKDRQDAYSQLQAMRGRSHQLLSAAVIYLDGEPLWRHVGIVRLHMHEFSDAYLNDYLDRNWESIRGAVGSYKLEEEGVRLFRKIEGDYFHVLGLPLLELLSYLTIRGTLPA